MAKRVKWIELPDKVLNRLPPDPTPGDIDMTVFLVKVNRDTLSPWEQELYDYWRNEL